MFFYVVFSTAACPIPVTASGSNYDKFIVNCLND